MNNSIGSRAFCSGKHGQTAESVENLSMNTRGRGMIELQRFVALELIRRSKLGCYWILWRLISCGLSIFQINLGVEKSQVKLRNFFIGVHPLKVWRTIKIRGSSMKNVMRKRIYQWKNISGVFFTWRFRHKAFLCTPVENWNSWSSVFRITVRGDFKKRRIIE